MGHSRTAASRTNDKAGAHQGPSTPPPAATVVVAVASRLGRVILAGLADRRGTSCSERTADESRPCLVTKPAQDRTRPATSPKAGHRAHFRRPTPEGAGRPR